MKVAASFAKLCAALALLALAGCPPPPPPQSAASVSAEALPSDPRELHSLLAKWSESHDRRTLENALVVADKLLAIAPGDYAAAWMGAHAAFHLADEAEGENDRRAWFAKRGIELADRAVKNNPKGVEGFYYRGINRGFLARTKTVGAIDLISAIAEDARTAMALDEKYDHAGPLRLYGTLLLKAPGWPTSIGDTDEALTRLQRAVELAPEQPLNQLYLGEALRANDKPAEAIPRFEEAVRLAALPEWSWMKARVDKEAGEQLAKARAKLR